MVYEEKGMLKDQWNKDLLKEILMGMEMATGLIL